MSNFELPSGRRINSKDRCFACKNGEFHLAGLRITVKHLNIDMYKEVWNCDNCGEISTRHWSK